MERRANSTGGRRMGAARASLIVSTFNRNPGARGRRESASLGSAGG